MCIEGEGLFANFSVSNISKIPLLSTPLQNLQRPSASPATGLYFFSTHTVSIHPHHIYTYQHVHTHQCIPYLTSLLPLSHTIYPILQWVSNTLYLSELPRHAMPFHVQKRFRLSPSVTIKSYSALYFFLRVKLT